MDFFTTGNSIVDQIGRISITGDVIPVIWFETILTDKGKPAYLPILILSDILYWYKPVEVRDERTGRVIGWRKKFDGPMLQRDYKQWADKYGESERTIMRAIDRLIDMQVVIKHNETVETTSGLIRNNVLFWEIVPEKVFELTYPNREAVRDVPIAGAYETYRIIPPEEKNEKHGNTPYDKSVISHMTNLSGAYGQKCYKPSDKNVNTLMTELSGDSRQKCHMPHDNGGRGCSNNMPNGDKDYIHPSINPSHPSIQEEIPELEESNLSLRDVVAANINLPGLLENAENTGIQRLVGDAYEVICEVMTSGRDTVKINTIDYPVVYVRNRFLRLREDQIHNVVERVRKEQESIGNMHSYLTTALYHESFNCVL